MRLKNATMYEITIERTFVATHALRHYKGGTEPSHEHSWRVWITVGGSELNPAGCIVDFHEIADWFDHAVANWRGQNLNVIPPFTEGNLGLSPSAENVARTIYDSIVPLIPKTTRLIRVEVEEETGCRAAYQGIESGGVLQCP